jgi:hypothetical protein
MCRVFCEEGEEHELQLGGGQLAATWNAVSASEPAARAETGTEAMSVAAPASV